MASNTSDSEKRARLERDAQVLKISGYEVMSSTELENAIECTWEKLEMKELEIEDDVLESEDKWDIIYQKK